MEQAYYEIPNMRFLPILLVLLSTPASGWAHDVKLTCKQVGDRVEVNAFYDDRTDAGGAEIKVENADKKVIAKGITDAQGFWSFPAPGEGAYMVHVDAGFGHLAHTELIIGTSTPDGPTREEMTRTPWGKIAIGLIVIAAMSAAFLLASRLRKGGKATINEPRPRGGG